MLSAYFISLMVILIINNIVIIRGINYDAQILNDQDHTDDKIDMYHHKADSDSSIISFYLNRIEINLTTFVVVVK
jgi:hypothetical protein